MLSDQIGVLPAPQCFNKGVDVLHRVLLKTHSLHRYDLWTVNGEDKLALRVLLSELGFIERHINPFRETLKEWNCYVLVLHVVPTDVGLLKGDTFSLRIHINS